MSSQRLSKRELVTVDDEDSSSEPPAVKNKKREDELSPEVVELLKKVAELQEKNDKSGNMFEAALDIAAQAQARVEFLEELIDTKPKVVDSAKTSPEVVELQKKVAELQEKNDKSENKFQAAINIGAQAHARVCFLEELLDTKPKVADIGRNKDREDELEKKVSQLTVELEEERVRHCERIDKLTGVVGTFQQWVTRVQRMPGFTCPPEPQLPLHEVILELGISISNLHDPHAHPTNILQLCNPNTPDTIAVGTACIQLKSAINQVLKNHKKRCIAGNYEGLECVACARGIPNHGVIDHFLSKEHKRQARGAAVSLAAFQHWFRLVQPTVREATKEVVTHE